jgi:Phytanoyl-CoA dioxygenase (PhyH)
MSYLSQAQVEHFLRRGFVKIEGCFDPDEARRWVERAWSRMGYLAEDKSSWTEMRVHLPSRSWVDAREFAPRAWHAAIELAGGPDRLELPWQWSDGLIANLGVGSDRPWEPPSPRVSGWHKDGDFFRHFLDSPEQGLLTFVLWTDMLSTGGGTFVAADSVPVIARFLKDHPEGVLPDDFPYSELVPQCEDFVEMTGKAGDVVLLHPYVLHATSQNVLRVPRFISNPPLALRQPMNFDREDPADYSLVEQAILRGLGVQRLRYLPTAPREQVIPQRVLDEQAAAHSDSGRNR